MVFDKLLVSFTLMAFNHLPRPPQIYPPNPNKALLIHLLHMKPTLLIHLLLTNETLLIHLLYM